MEGDLLVVGAKWKGINHLWDETSKWKGSIQVSGRGLTSCGSKVEGDKPLVG